MNRFYYCREIDHKGFFENQETTAAMNYFETTAAMNYFAFISMRRNWKCFTKIINIVILLKILGVLYLDLTYTISGNTNMVPQNYPVEQIVQLCLLDKELPHFVAQIETILKQYQKPQDEKWLI